MYFTVLSHMMHSLPLLFSRQPTWCDETTIFTYERLPGRQVGQASIPVPPRAPARPLAGSAVPASVRPTGPASVAIRMLTEGSDDDDDDDQVDEDDDCTVVAAEEARQPPYAAAAYAAAVYGAGAAPTEYSPYKASRREGSGSGASASSAAAAAASSSWSSPVMEGMKTPQRPREKQPAFYTPSTGAAAAASAASPFALSSSSSLAAGLVTPLLQKAGMKRPLSTPQSAGTITSSPFYVQRRSPKHPGSMLGGGEEEGGGAAGRRSGSTHGVSGGPAAAAAPWGAGGRAPVKRRLPTSPGAAGR